MKKRNKSPPVVHGSLNLYYRKLVIPVVFCAENRKTGSFRPAQAMAGDAIASKVR